MANVDKKLENLRKALKEDLYYDREELNKKSFEYMVREEGREEKALEIAKEMLKNNLSTEMIIKCTGLSQEEINSLREDN